MRWLLGLLAAVVVTAGLTAGAVAVFDLDDGDAAAPASTTTTVVPGLAPDQTTVAGTVTVLVAEGALIDPLLTPLTIGTPSAGLGAGATIQAALVEGTPSEIVWDAGRPLELSGESGALLPGPVRVDADAAGVRFLLDGPVHGFTPGVYRIDTPVAVGAQGIARPVDAVSFDATDATTAVFAGGATVGFGPVPFALRGPGRLSLQGVFELTTADGTRAVTTVTFGSDPFELTLTPVEGGFTVTGTLQGPLEAS